MSYPARAEGVGKYACRIHIDAMNKDERRLIFKKIYLLLYLKRLCVRGSWRPNRTATYWPPLLWPSALCLSCSLDAQPEARVPSFLLAFSTASCLQFLWSPTDWLPVFTELYNNSIAHWISLNGMFDCYQTEKTVVQFTDHSLLVCQSMTVAWDFTLSHIVSQARLRDFFW